jgi:hypothetical protein
MQSIQGENIARQAQFFHESLGCWDFIGFGGYLFMRQDYVAVAEKSAQYLHGFMILKVPRNTFPSKPMNCLSSSLSAISWLYCRKLSSNSGPDVPCMISRIVVCAGILFQFKSNFSFSLS